MPNTFSLHSAEIKDAGDCTRTEIFRSAFALPLCAPGIQSTIFVPMYL